MSIEPGKKRPSGDAGGGRQEGRPRALDNLERLKERIHEGERARTGPAPAAAPGDGTRAAAVGKEVGKQTLWVLGKGLKWVLSTFLGLVIFIVWLEMRSCARSVITGEGEKDVTDADRAALVTAADLPMFASYVVEPGNEYMSKYSDGDHVYLNYDVSAYDEDTEYGVNLVVNVTICEDEDAARRIFSEQERENRYAFEEAGDELDDRTDEFTWGDQCTFWAWESDYPVIYFQARKGERVYELIINGFELMDTESLRSILGPKLRKLEEL